MKQESNNEMDLLLRRLGRRPDISVSDANGDVDHLDADELNAYAENVLPAGARARYTEHLTECARCRGLIVQLSSAAGVIPASETAVPAGPSALRKFLASLFSPMVLRYAVPALGLILVAALGLFVLRSRSQREDGSVARLTQEQEAKSFTKTDQVQSNYKAEPKEVAKPSQTSGSPENKPAAAAAPPSGGLPSNAALDTPAKKLEQQPVKTEEAPPPKAPAATDERQGDIAAASKEAGKGQVTQPVAENTVRVEPTDKVEDRKAAEIKPASSAPASGVQGGAFGVGAMSESRARAKTQRDDAAAKDKDDAATETRTVAGRRFRKQGGVWVDTAYNFSRTATSLTRSSEQFRALIADEPELKTIADELDGEILVIWKGRPYRIK